MELYCNGKRAYDKRGAVTAMNRRYREDHVKLRMYECNHGDHWHLTKQLRKMTERKTWRHVRRKRTQ